MNNFFKRAACLAVTAVMTLSSTGALACTSPGDWEGAPRLRDLEALLSGGGADPVSR